MPGSTPPLPSTITVIHFTESWRYDNEAARPSVALLDNGQVLEAHYGRGGLLSRTGWLSLSDPRKIDWSAPVIIDTNDTSTNAALAANGTAPVVTYNRGLQFGHFETVKPGEI
jgi:hypothetical protein